MKPRATLFVIFFILTFLLIGLALPAHSAEAAPHLQGFVTATPGPDGRILYTVVKGDTCSQIAFLHGITVQQLRIYNSHLDENCTLTVGEQLVVGLVQQPAGPTPGPSPTPTLLAFTATPFSGTTEVCVLLFDDKNGDALRQTTEFGIDGGAVSLTNLNGSYSKTLTTSSNTDPNTGDPVRSCFSDVPPGDYNISMAVPDGYNPTMLLSYKITVEAGDRVSVDFGAQSKTDVTSEPVQSQSGGGQTAILGIFGVLLLLGGLGLGYYAYRSNQPRSKLKGSPLDRK